MHLELLSLFWLAFLSATLLPGGSEVYLLHLVEQNPQSIFWLWLIAILGNTLGSVINYLLGRYFLHYQDRKWFPIKINALEKSQYWFQKYGRWSLLVAWVPIIGDALTLIAGVMKTVFWQFLLLVLIGKALRYALLIALFLGLFSGE